MSRRIAALKPQLNRIRAWAHEGSTDAWIAHQLETTAESVRAFRQEHGIERGGPAPLAPITPDSVVEAMLAEEAAALEAGPEPAAQVDAAESEPAPARTPRRRTRKAPAEEAGEQPADADEPADESAAADESGDGPADEAPAPSTRRRGARGGAGRSSGRTPAAVEPEAAAETDSDDERADESESDEPRSEDAPGADEHVRGPRKRGRRRGRGRGNRGLEARLLPGSVLLLDPSVTADAVFQEHWRDAGALRVEVSSDAIVLRRIAADAEPERPQS